MTEREEYLEEAARLLAVSYGYSRDGAIRLIDPVVPTNVNDLHDPEWFVESFIEHRQRIFKLDVNFLASLRK